MEPKFKVGDKVRTSFYADWKAEVIKVYIKECYGIRYDIRFLDNNSISQSWRTEELTLLTPLELAMV